MGTIGVPELIVIFVIALIVFGPKKLPELGKSLGKGLSEFRKASNDLRSTIEEEVRAIESEPPPPPALPEKNPVAVQKPPSESNVDAH
jgi:sec-independent protein translocase protein TatA